MSKERLEEIKKHRNEADNCTDEYEFEKINFYNLHVEWLIEQAGRVQELEEEVGRYQSGRNVAVITKMKMDVTQERNERLEKRVQKLENRIADDEHFVAEILEQNKRYRETIEEAIEYANSPKILTSPAGIEKILSKALEESK